jgi:hypothetical protein
VIDMRTSSRSASSSAFGGPIGTVVVISGPGGSPVHDLLHQLDQRDAGGVSGVEAGDVGVGVDVGQGVGAPLEVVVQLGEAAVELLAEPSPDQARRRRVDRQLGEPVEQVDLATVAPAATISSTSRWIVSAWPRMKESRSAWLCSISRRRSGGASNTTPSPKIGVMKG